MSVNLPVQSTGALPTVRRLVLYILLFTLVTLAAVGAAGLLGLLFTSGTGEDSERTNNLARSLAFVIIAGPLALLLWRSLAKRLLDSFESAALAWGLYVAAMYSTSLVVASTGLFSLLGKLLSAHTQGWAQDLSTALIWAAVCWWHHQMWSDPRRSPRSLPNLPGILASWYAVILVATATVSALVMVFSATIDSIFNNFSAGSPWWRGALAQLPWIVGGLALWWWHWTRKHMGMVRGGFSDVALVLLGLLAAGAAALGGAGYLLYALGRSAVHGTDAQSLSPVPLSLGAALVGALIFSLAWQELGSRSVETMSAGRLVSAGLGLASMASGFGVCINALLAALTPPLAGDRGIDLLLAGLIWLVLGSLVWVWAWRPHKPADPRGRRVYLVAVFGASAVVALIALLFAGFRIFTFFLEPGTVASGLLDSVRAPIGLLTATLLVAIYHFAVWRSDRTLIEAAEPASSGTIESIILVAGEDSPEISRALGSMTGAKIKVLVRAGEGYQASADDLTAALDAAETQSPRIMLLVEGAGSVRVIDLA